MKKEEAENLKDVFIFSIFFSLTRTKMLCFYVANKWEKMIVMGSSGLVGYVHGKRSCVSHLILVKCNIIVLVKLTNTVSE